VVIKNPGHVVIEHVTKVCPAFIAGRIRSIAALDSKRTGTRKGKTGGDGADAAHCAPKWN